MGLVSDARKNTLSGATLRSAGPGTAWMAMVPWASETPSTAQGRTPVETIEPASVHGFAQVSPGGLRRHGAGTSAATISSGDDRRVTRTDLIAAHPRAHR